MNRAERRRAGCGPEQVSAGASPARLRAASALAAGRIEEAEALYARCLADDPADLSSLHDLGVVAARRGRHAEAIARFEAVLARRPGHVDACTNLALSLCDAGRPDEAVVAARRGVALRPRDPNIHTVLGHVLGATEDLAGAAAACGSALALDPGFVPAHLRRAKILRRMGNTDGSLDACDAVGRLRPGEVTGLVERGVTLVEAGRRAEAEAAFRAALGRDPSSGDALAGLGRVLFETADADAALSELDRGMARAPEFGRLHILRGLLLQKRGRLAEAQASFKRAIEVDPGDASAYLNMGNLLLKSERWVEAVLFLEHAARLQPRTIEAYERLAEAHRQLGHHSAAITLLEHACGLAPERIDLRWMACWARMHACAWQDYEGRVGDLMARAVAAGHTISPFMIMAFGLSDLETHLWTRAWAELTMPRPRAPVRRPAGARMRADGRIRLGYLSADFRSHATAALLSEVLRLQDRSRFELVGYNIGRSDGSAMGHGMVSALDRFVDLAILDDREAAERIAADGVDILVDLKGFTTDSRPGILAHRPAPVQVNYLGYPGSMGTNLVDYILADPVVAPFAHQPFFDEAIVHLPHSYQPNDRRRPGADPDASRAAHGLPATGFVFCCFNNNYKLTPLVFGLWMRLLDAMPGSVLWLLQGNDLAVVNLRSVAEQRGIAPDRIVFAPRTGYEEHLSRLGLADLFLDTLPVNAHTTASEALWAGVPVLTCRGSHFTSRVAASLLTAVGLPELVTESLADYEREALALARDPARLGALRGRLETNRLTAPLFDTPRYVRSYEAALERMVERAEAGLLPVPFAVADDADVGIGRPAAVREREAPSGPGRPLENLDAVVVRRLGGLGDVLMALSALAAVRAATGLPVYIETSPAYESLAASCPDVAGVFTDPNAIAGFFRRSGLTAVRYVDWSPVGFGLSHLHQVDAFLMALGLALPDAQKTLRIALTEEEDVTRHLERIPRGRRTVVLHPGLTDPNRTWPRPFWQSLAEHLVAAGDAVVVIGGRHGPDGKSVTSLDHPRILDLSDRLSFQGTIRLLQRCDVLVSGDSGPIQLAGASDIAIIGLYSVVAGENRLPQRAGAAAGRAVAIAPSCPFHPCYPRMQDPETLARFCADEGVVPSDVSALFSRWCVNPDRYACVRESDTLGRVKAALAELGVRGAGGTA